MSASLPLAHPAVWDEFGEALRYFAENAGVDILDSFQACIYKHFTEIKRSPLIHRERVAGIRRVNLGPRFKEWYIAYMIWKESVVILAIGHAKRRPFYFAHRVAWAKRMF